MSDIEVALLTGGGDRPYAVGLATALLAKGVAIDFLGSDDLDSPDLRASPGLRFLNVRGGQRADVSAGRKVSRVLAYYARLLGYAWRARPEIFHVLWNNKLEWFDRTLLMLYYRTLRRRVVLTVHNVNAGIRDANDSSFNRLTLCVQYRLAHHIFVHTGKMKTDLVADFGVPEQSISVIPFAMNSTLADTALTSSQAKRRLGILDGERTILFFGAIRPYKGLEHLVAAFQRLVAADPRYRLVIVGPTSRESARYLDRIRRKLDDGPHGERVILKPEYIPDDEAEVYFKAADVFVLPYTHVFQSGVLFSGYRFGLPVVATDVGSLRDDIVEGVTGYVCRPRDPADLAAAIATYFDSELFARLEAHRLTIRTYAGTRHSWDIVAETTRGVYASLSRRGGEYGLANSRRRRRPSLPRPHGRPAPGAPTASDTEDAKRTAVLS